MLAASCLFFSCNTATQILSTLPTPLTEYEVVEGLKEALTIGSNNAGNLLHKEDAFFKNQIIKILFPPEVADMEKKLRAIGMGSEIDKLILTMNRAAEKAAVEAIPIFSNAVAQMSIQDGMTILKGKDNEATLYLKKHTYESLKNAFQPKVKESLNSVGFFSIWNPLMNTYNQLPFITKVDPDLDKYVTEKSLDGLFVTLAKEEYKIRKDPVARVTDLLKKVFGSI